MDDAVRLTYAVALSPEQYGEDAYRQTSEASCRRKIVKHAENEGLVLIDGAVGRWEQVTQDFDGDPWTRWEYRMVGLAVPRG